MLVASSAIASVEREFAHAHKRSRDSQRARGSARRETRTARVRTAEDAASYSV